MITQKEKMLFYSIMLMAREQFAGLTAFSICEIDGINGLQIVLTDIHSGQILKKTSLVKHLSKTNYHLVRNT